MDDDLILVEDDQAITPSAKAPWVVLVVDDEPGVHDITSLVLDDFKFDGRGVQLINAYSAAEAHKILSERGDIAVVLLDVVMETDTAGLELTERIRNELHNRMVRIVLRTGQPAVMSESEVVRNYEINDYRIKTELTMQRLQEACTLALRAFRDLQLSSR